MAGSNNILQWNPGAANQENDSAYLADSQRTGGAPNGVLFPSATGNKLFYNISTFCAAFAQSLANKGYNISDASISTLESTLANIVTFADLRANLTSVSFSTTPTFNASATNGFDFVLAGNVTASTLTGQQIGQTLTFVIAQGATPFTFSPPSNINGWIPINPVANSISIQQFIVRTDGTIWPIATEINLILAELITIAAEIAALQASNVVKNQFTLPSGSLTSGASTTYDTGIACSPTNIAFGSVLSGPINPILTYQFSTAGGTIKLFVANTSSSTISYGSLVYNCGLL